MTPTVHGLHHITCIAGNAQENLDFYVGVLGMRLVKRSVNQDAPDTYHLFYADGAGSPGTDLTFFPWPAMGPGRLGTGLAVEVSLAVPSGSLTYWQDRLDRHGVSHGAVENRFGEANLPLVDPHGLALTLVETASARDFTPWDGSPVPAGRQVLGLHSVRLWERRLAPTETLLTTHLGFTLVGEEGGWRRFAAEGGGSGAFVDLREMPDERPGAWGTGSVHHVAWRVADIEEELAVAEAVAQVGLRTTSPIDRFWFKSVYFREPGGTLFELATDGPGFARDEDPAHLGETLILPPWLEQHRRAIEAGLPPLVMPATLS
jgi:glyoxalase family protein